MLARLVMLRWDQLFLKRIEQVGIKLWMYLRLVDDSNMAAEAVEPGSRLVGDRVSILRKQYWKMRIFQQIREQPI